jgi:N-acetylglucosaminyl-diphospho-decaprenol L-rhamnosyltransferase
MPAEAEQARDPIERWCSLITVTYNSSATLRRFWGTNPLPADVEWIVVDNASTDGSAEVAESLGARVIRLDRNMGFSHANNLGAAAASGNFLGFVNPDVSVIFEDLPGLMLVASQRNALVSPQLVNPDGSRQPNGRGYPLLVDKVRNRLGREKELTGRYLLYSPNDEPRAVVWLMGATIFATRSAFERVGGWDDYFFLYYEDKDICLRAWDRGLRVLLAPDARWVHGWARETTSARTTPWKREIASMAKFYRRYPRFLLWRGAAQRRSAVIHQSVFEK